MKAIADSDLIPISLPTAAAKVIGLPRNPKLMSLMFSTRLRYQLNLCLSQKPKTHLQIFQTLDHSCIWQKPTWMVKTAPTMLGKA
jgi:hypothetical protein